MLTSPLTNHLARSPPFFRKLHPNPISHFMGRTTCRTTTFSTYARAVAARIHNSRKNPPSKPKPKSKPVISAPSQPTTASSPGVRERRMETHIAREERVPLSVVVSDCVRRWFEDTLVEASNGDASMQVLVAQMYRSGYGVAKDERLAKKWIREASKHRSSASKDGKEHPGYIGSESDSDKVEESGKQ